MVTFLFLLVHPWKCRLKSFFEEGEREVDGEYDCVEKLVEAEVLLEETDLLEVQVQDEYSSSSPRTSDYVDIENSQIDSNELVIKSQPRTVGNISNDVNFVRLKLDKAQELLLNSFQTVALFGSLERENIEIDRLSGENEALEDSAQLRQQECESSKHLSSEWHERRNLLEKKLLAIEYSISSFSLSIGCFEEQELQARARSNSALTHLNQKHEKLARLQASRHEIMQAREKLGNTKTDIVKLTQNLEKLDGEIQAALVELERGLMSVKEMQNKLRSITQVKEAILEMEENGKSDFEYLVLEYHRDRLVSDLKEEDWRIFRQEFLLDVKRLVELLRAD